MTLNNLNLLQDDVTDTESTFELALAVELHEERCPDTRRPKTTSHMKQFCEEEWSRLLLDVLQVQSTATETLC